MRVALGGERVEGWIGLVWVGSRDTISRFVLGDWDVLFVLGDWDVLVCFVVC